MENVIEEKQTPLPVDAEIYEPAELVLVEQPVQPKTALERFRGRVGEAMASSMVLGLSALALASAAPERRPTDEHVHYPGIEAEMPPPQSYSALQEITGQRLAISGLSATQERATTDRPDIVAGPKVKLYYMTAKNGPDNRYDENGVLESTFWHSQDWTAKAAGGLSLRVDTYRDAATGEERPDIMHIPSAMTMEEIKNSQSFIAYEVGKELAGRGIVKDLNKIPLVMLDADINSSRGSDVLCGVAANPDHSPYSLSIINLQEPACGPLVPPGSENHLFIFYPRDKTIPHEVTHAIGHVRPSSPTYDGTNHSTDIRDMMYGKAVSAVGQLEAMLVDPDRNDYWNDLVPPFYMPQHHAMDIKVEGGGDVKFSSMPNRYLGPWANQCEDDCKPWFRRGMNVSLTATPDDDSYRFKGWQGAGEGNEAREVSIDNPQSVTAVFEPIGNLGVRVRKPGMGTVRTIGQGICRNVCDYELLAGTRANLVAKPARNSRFERWVGGCGVRAVCAVPVKHGQNQKLTAIFSKKKS